jgi:hypothetical protein
MTLVAWDNRALFWSHQTTHLNAGFGERLKISRLLTKAKKNDETGN